jgi:cupin fold WbuC family metalloprotein
MSNAAFPRALPPPAGALIRVNRALIEQAIKMSRRSPRGRIILPFHGSESELFHRMLNAMQPGSYVRPHRHIDPPKSESFVVLRGRVACATYEDGGAVREVFTASANDDAVGFDVRAGVWHNLFALEPDTVLFEAKNGPYSPNSDKNFAPWAPAEGSPEAPAYLARLMDLARK